MFSALPQHHPLSWLKIFDISAEISAKYRISVTTEAKSVMEIRLREKPLKNRKFRRYFAVGDFLLQNIEDISEVSVKYRRYIRNIGKNIGDISEISVKISKIYRDISAIYRDI